ncbi:MAG: PH domain-containing protein, partial [Stackebrandtia sp.]
MAAPAWRPSTRAPLLWAAGPAVFWLLVLVGGLVWLTVDSAHRDWALELVAAAVALAAFTAVAVPMWRYSVHRWE